MARDGTPDIRVSGLTKTFGDVVAVDAIDLEIASGEFFTMLGPSGSGKTTTLRMIAGFEAPDEGTVELASRRALRDRGLDRPGVLRVPAGGRNRADVRSTGARRGRGRDPAPVATRVSLRPGRL